MSNFKEKNIKYSTFCQNVLKKSAIVHGTLDAKHNEIMKDFAKKKKSLPKLTEKLNQLKQDIDLLNHIPKC
jgi:polyhydroxyalkanoate synthesis regulator phasin